VKKTAFWALLCAAAIAFNLGLSALAQFVLHLPLFLDTVATVSLTLYGGFWAGAAAGALTNIMLVPAYNVPLVTCVYAVCNVAAALVTALFVRLFPGEFAPCRRNCAAPRREEPPVAVERVIALLALSLALCFAISILGGIISAVLQTQQVTPPRSPDQQQSIGLDLSLSRLIYLRQGLPAAAVEILARLPVNIIDRLITAFGAYWLARLLRNFSPGKLSPPPP
jgi:hypothetical protein